MLRHMLIHEQGDELHLLAGAPGPAFADLVEKRINFVAIATADLARLSDPVPCSQFPFLSWLPTSWAGEGSPRD